MLNKLLVSMTLIDFAFGCFVAGIIVLVYTFLIQRFAAAVTEPQPVKRYPYRKGMKVFKCDLTDPEYLVVEAPVKKIENENGEVVSQQVMIEENCIYELAINTENAVRKMEKRILESLRK